MIFLILPIVGKSTQKKGHQLSFSTLPYFCASTKSFVTFARLIKFFNSIAMADSKEKLFSDFIAPTRQEWLD